MSGYQVDHQQLAGAGAQIARHGEDTQPIQAQISDAMVPTKAWGLLGITLAFPVYQELLGTLEVHMGQMRKHLGETGQALGDTAKAYQKLEDELKLRMEQLIEALDNGDSALPGQTEVQA